MMDFETYHNQVGLYFLEFYSLGNKLVMMSMDFRRETTLCPVPHHPTIGEYQTVVVPTPETIQLLKDTRDQFSVLNKAHKRMCVPVDSWGESLEVEYTFKIDLYSDMKTIMKSINDQLEKLKIKILDIKRNDPYAVSDYIRKKNGDIVNPFKAWRRQITCFKEYVKNGCKIDDSLALSLCEDRVRRTTKDKYDSAYQNCKQDIMKAIVFIERAVAGTFPYGENGEWECNTKDIKLK